MSFQDEDRFTEEEVPLPIKWRLTKDLRNAATLLSASEARYLVDLYYQVQRRRIRAAQQANAASEAEEPNELISWVQGSETVLESSIKSAMGIYAESQRLGRWALSQTGVGPVLAGGLLAHIGNLAPWKCAKPREGAVWAPCTPEQPHGPECHELRINTVGQIWRFAGLDPTQKWNKGEKRPWNAALKVLCWKIGESFVKQSGKDSCYYGKVYAERKKLEVERSHAGLFRETAERALVEKKWREGTLARAAYEKGELPAARLQLRSQRYAVKLFLSHWHWVAHEIQFGSLPPKPYVVEHLGHAHLLTPPNWPID